MINLDCEIATELVYRAYPYMNSLTQIREDETTGPHQRQQWVRPMETTIYSSRSYLYGSGWQHFYPMNDPLSTTATLPTVDGFWKPWKAVVDSKSAQNTQLENTIATSASIPGHIRNSYSSAASANAAVTAAPSQSPYTALLLASSDKLSQETSNDSFVSLSHLLSSDTASAPPSAAETNPASINGTSSVTGTTSKAAAEPTRTSARHANADSFRDKRTIVLACVLGGVLGLVGCAIIGFCLFNLSGWYSRRKQRNSQARIFPGFTTLEKMDSNDPLACLDNSIEVRRGSTLYISSPLDGDNILRLKQPPPVIPPKNPKRQARQQHTEPADQAQKFYQVTPRPEIRTPRPAPPPPLTAAILLSGHHQHLKEQAHPELTQIIASDSETQQPPVDETDYFQLNKTDLTSAQQGQSIGQRNSQTSYSVDKMHSIQEKRSSISSSCYSGLEADRLETPQCNLVVDIGRISQFSFNCAVQTAASSFEEEPSLEPIDETGSSGQESKKVRASPEVTRTSAHFMQNESSPELYDDGAGAYPTHILQASESLQASLSPNMYPNIMGADTLENLDLFESPPPN